MSADYEKGFADAKNQICEDVLNIVVDGVINDRCVLIDLSEMAKILKKYGGNVSQQFIDSLPDDKQQELIDGGERDA